MLFIRTRRILIIIHDENTYESRFTKGFKNYFLFHKMYEIEVETTSFVENIM